MPSSRRRGASDAAATGALPRAEAPRPRSRKAAADARAERPRKRAAGRAARASRAGRRAADPGATPDAGRRTGRARTTRRTDFMRYAADNRAVRAIYAVVAGPYRVFFYLVVALAALAAIYFPVRDMYVAYRTGDILERQYQIREAYNKSLQSDVDALLSHEGIEDAARDQLGLVMPGEKRIDVIEPDDTATDAESGSDGSTDTADDTAQGDAATDAAQDAAEADAAAEAPSEPTTSAEALAAERAVAEDAPWYIKILDGIFFFTGVDGQRVASTGE